MEGVRVWRVWEAVVKDVCIYRMSLSQSSGWKCFTVTVTGKKIIVYIT